MNTNLFVKSSRKINAISVKKVDNITNIITEVTFELKSALANILLASELLEISSLSTEQEMFAIIIQRNSKRISNLTAI